MKFITPIFNAKVIQDRDKTYLQFTNKKALANYLRTLIGKDCLVSIEKKRKIRSLNENNYFHGVILPILSDFTGHSPKAIKDYLKMELAPKKEVLNKWLPKGTSEMNTSEFEQFAADCRNWALEQLDVLIPLPNEIL